MGLNLYEVIVGREHVKAGRRKRRQWPPWGAPTVLADATSANWRQKRRNAVQVLFDRLELNEIGIARYILKSNSQVADHAA